MSQSRSLSAIQNCYERFTPESSQLVQLAAELSFDGTIALCDLKAALTYACRSVIQRLAPTLQRAIITAPRVPYVEGVRMVPIRTEPALSEVVLLAGRVANHRAQELGLHCEAPISPECLIVGTLLQEHLLTLVNRWAVADALGLPRGCLSMLVEQPIEDISLAELEELFGGAASFTDLVLAKAKQAGQAPAGVQREHLLEQLHQLRRHL